MTEPVPRPVPEPTAVSAPFWESLRRHRIRIQYSPSLAEYVFYPRLLAPRTLADDLEWREISGLGTLYTYTVTHRPTAPPWRDAVPQSLAVVQWDEGPRFSTELVDVDPAEIWIGMRVEPVFTELSGEDVTMLRYRPAAGGAAGY
ncbi:putative nucleic-acid-binding protein containing a Zn-ribbon [Saccharomonospora marina XMU15]|uniref:Putative nucleic-acid-binding protein containing a Zn-ribbon n=1 Tax=Saccharomonospora marina XMU15 TaxID=882083 RepID=H5X9D6_9PSEU|nr:OB-fold domain-containing protein [Saccharomonospora marina]EHR50301.1 putative nucleic-acid-binding protein containing a Zn-ribbon [Saccharomonospora marina XMU15]